MNAVIFGAGNIGLGFLGHVLARAGHTLTFIDVDARRVATLNATHGYRVCVVSAQARRDEDISHARAVCANDTVGVERAVLDADIVLTAVGKAALPSVARTLARALALRLRRRREHLHVTAIACENIDGNTTYLRGLMRCAVSDHAWREIDRSVSFPNCIVDRIVPASTCNEVLSVTVEEYYQFVVDASALRAPLTMAGVVCAHGLDALLEQKLCTLNMAHALVAYYGYLAGYELVHEAIENRTLRTLLAGAFAEVERVLTRKHSSISVAAQRAYAARVVERFRNQHLADPVVRVARDPLRKLGSGDRLMKPATSLAALGEPPMHLASGIAALLSYDHAGDAQAQTLVSELGAAGVPSVLAKRCGLVENSMLSQLVQTSYAFRHL